MNKTKIEWTDYKAGYIAGITAGDGTFRFTEKEIPYQAIQRYWRIALKDEIILKRLRQYLRKLGIRLDIKSFSGKGMQKIETRRFDILKKILKILNPPFETPPYKKGYLAGIFDAEGNWYRSNLRIYNSNPHIIKRLILITKELGFTFTEEKYPSKKANGVRLRGDRFDQAKFLCVIKSVKSRWYLRHIFWNNK